MFGCSRIAAPLVSATLSPPTNKTPYTDLTAGFSQRPWHVRTRFLPLILKLRGKSTTQSHRAPVFYVDLSLPDGISLKEAVAQARIEAAQQEAAGVDIQALEAAARLALANGAFEDSEEEIPAIVDEFYPDEDLTKSDQSAAVTGGLSADAEGSTLSKLSERLESKANRLDAR